MIIERYAAKVRKRSCTLRSGSETETKIIADNLGAYAMKSVAAGAHLPTPCLFEPAKRPDERAEYCLGNYRLTYNCQLQLNLNFTRSCEKTNEVVFHEY